MILIFGASGGRFSHFYFKIRVNDASWWVSIGDETSFDYVSLYLNRCVKTVAAYPCVKAAASATSVTEWWCMFWGFLLVWQGNNYHLQYSRLWPWSISSCVGLFVISGKPSVALLTKAYRTVYHDIPLLYRNRVVAVCVSAPALLYLWQKFEIKLRLKLNLTFRLERV